MKKFTLLAVTMLAVTTARADDWPQWQGPDRTNVSKEKGVLKSWPSEGPKRLWWFKEAGAGYSGVAVVGKVAYTLGGVSGGKEFVLAIDTEKGTKLWSTDIAPYKDNGYGGGPRGTPTVEGEFVYALSADGTLACLKTSGDKVWSTSLTSKLGGGVPNWNYSESPLIDGDVVLCTPGGRGTVAALNKKDGTVKWQSTGSSDRAGYSSIIIAETNGNKIYVQQTMAGVIGIDPKEGKVLWSVARSKYRTAVIPTPIYADNAVYVAAGYGAGSTLISLADGGKSAKVTWENGNMDNKHGGVVRVGDAVFGYSDKGGWTCQDFKKGTVLWSSNKLERGSITCVEDRLYCYGERGGECVLIEASKESWNERGRLTIPEKSKNRSQRGGIWTHPVVSNGKLFLRDQELVFCYDVKDGK